MNGLHPIKMPSAKEKVAAELRKAILSRQLQEGETGSNVWYLYEEIAGESPSMYSTSGFSIWPRNCLAYEERLSM